jgi:hypothetical protein
LIRGQYHILERVMAMSYLTDMACAERELDTLLESGDYDEKEVIARYAILEKNVEAGQAFLSESNPARRAAAYEHLVGVLANPWVGGGLRRLAERAGRDRQRKAGIRKGYVTTGAQRGCCAKSVTVDVKGLLAMVAAGKMSVAEASRLMG